jgi:hypothetical protein
MLSLHCGAKIFISTQPTDNGRKSEKSKYHPDQKLLLPELLEELIGELADGASGEMEIGVPETESQTTKSTNRPKRLIRSVKVATVARSCPAICSGASSSDLT